MHSVRGCNFVTLADGNRASGQNSKSKFTLILVNSFINEFELNFRKKCIDRNIIFEPDASRKSVGISNLCGKIKPESTKG